MGSWPIRCITNKKEKKKKMEFGEFNRERSYPKRRRRFNQSFSVKTTSSFEFPRWRRLLFSFLETLPFKGPYFLSPSKRSWLSPLISDRQLSISHLKRLNLTGLYPSLQANLIFTSFPPLTCAYHRFPQNLTNYFEQQWPYHKILMIWGGLWSTIL